ncbi:MAG: hypothetical protein LBQ54_03300 [Planctomycetaceae bacterium]|nr:hypothetical protein [Planctomycetaceae bacterium]
MSDEEFVYANFSSSVTLTLEYSLEYVGKTVWYQFRWVNLKNDPGPWSENIVSAVIG